MAKTIPYGSENFLPREEIEYLDAQLVDMPPGVEVDVMYNSFSVASDGKLYMGTCCTFGSGHILCYDPRTNSISDVANMDEVFPDIKQGYDRQGKIHGRFFECGGMLYGATHMDIATPFYGNYYDKKRYKGGHWFRLDPKTGKVDDLGISRAGEGILTYTMDVTRKILYGVTWPSGYLYSFDVDTGESRNLGRTSVHLSRFLHIMSDGTVFYSMKDSFIGRYRHGEDCIESLPIGFSPRISDIDWAWRKGVMQGAVEWEENRSFIAFAGNPIRVSRDEQGSYSLKNYPLFKHGVYAAFEPVLSAERKIIYTHTEWSEPYCHSARLFQFDPVSGQNELLGYLRCGDLCDIRHVAGGAISPDRHHLYYFALVPKDLANRIDLTCEKLISEDLMFLRGEQKVSWFKKYFKPVLVICEL